ncbi:MAG TPA: 3-hydroxyacyl-CoA dehydrogenase [Paenibacillaceae bacterium]|nr:3-hydroxyacyl-CoA dehydrogenase [Paenibacillaceae bacterium]
MIIQGKTAVISGGASGLGEATARRLMHEGTNVVLLDINEEKGAILAEEFGERALFIKTNIVETESIEAAMDLAAERFGSIDIVVNCAGIVAGMKVAGKKGPHDLDIFKKVIDVNLIGVFDLVRQAASKMLSNEINEEGGKGVIINTASVAAFDGQIGQAAYTASKAAIAGMTLPLARDLAEEGVRVCAIAPGIFNTPMMAGLPEAVRDSLGKSVPFPSRLGHADEYAMLVQQIIENPMLNGETIRLDGAIRMAPR